MSELQSLPNIGKALDQRLQTIGIQSIEDLNALGSVETVIRLNIHNMYACVNTLYAIEGAIRGVRWHELSKKDRDVLREEMKSRDMLKKY